MPPSLVFWGLVMVVPLLAFGLALPLDDMFMVVSIGRSGRSSRFVGEGIVLDFWLSLPSVLSCFSSCGLLAFPVPGVSSPADSFGVFPCDSAYLFVSSDEVCKLVGFFV